MEPVLKVQGRKQAEAPEIAAPMESDNSRLVVVVERAGNQVPVEDKAAGDAAIRDDVFAGLAWPQNNF